MVVQSVSNMLIENTQRLYGIIFHHMIERTQFDSTTLYVYVQSNSNLSSLLILNTYQRHFVSERVYK